MKHFWNRIQELWCIRMHEKVMWPIHGHYFCAVCLREFPAIAEYPTPVRVAAGDDELTACIPPEDFFEPLVTGSPRS